MLGRRLTAVWRLVVLACSAIEGYFIAAIQRTALASGLRPDAVHFKVIVSICVFLHTRKRWLDDSYLVDPASSHMLVSKIKPCMSKYKLLYTVKLRMAH